MEYELNNIIHNRVILRTSIEVQIDYILNNTDLSFEVIKTKLNHEFDLMDSKFYTTDLRNELLMYERKLKIKKLRK